MKKTLLKVRAKFVSRSVAIAILGMTASGCVYDGGLDLGYASDGYASGCDSYSDFDSYYDCDYGYGFSNIGYGGGWYSDYYYPGYGYFVFDSYGRRYNMHRDHLRYWGGQRYDWYRNHGRGGHHGGGYYGGGGNYGDGGHHHGGGGNNGGGHHNGGNGNGGHDNGNGGDGHDNAGPRGVLDGGFGNIRNRPGKPVIAPAPGKRPPDAAGLSVPPLVNGNDRQGRGSLNGGFGRSPGERGAAQVIRQAPPVTMAPVIYQAPSAAPPPAPREGPRGSAQQQARFEKFRSKQD